MGVPFVDHLGVKLAEWGNGGSLLLLELKPEHRNSQGVAHGGVVMTLLDVAMARAARSTARDDGDGEQKVLTVEMKSTFMQAGSGDRLVARGRTVHRSATMCFAESEVHDEHGRLLARASGTFKYVRPRPIAHRAPK